MTAAFLVRRGTLSWGYGVFAVLSVLVAVMALRALVMPIPLVMPAMAHYLPDMPVPVWGHVVFAPLALALAPVQLSARLRARRPRLHRVTGYVYAGSILIAAASSLALLPRFLGTGFAAAGFAALAVLWVAFTALGIQAARNGDFAAHRRFMIRSATLSFAAVTLRLIMAPLLAAGWTVPETYQITAWGSWVPMLLAVEVWLRRR
jgi:uncharacterized membrane protein